MGGNQLCGINYVCGGTYTTEGIAKLCEGLKGSAITSLACVAAPLAPRSRVRPRAGHTRILACSLNGNQICGIGTRGFDLGGVTECITKLREGVKGSAITSLGCAAAP